MNSKGITLLAIAFIAIGIFALPGTISMFGGQHNWYDVSPPGGNDVPCEKCHGDVADELGNSGPHVNMECWYCHRTGNLTGYTYASGDGTASIPGEEAHAASTVECMECHEGFGISTYSCLSCHSTGPNDHPVEWFDEPCGNCHAEYTGEAHFSSTLEAGGFNLTINSSDTGTAAAHKAFVNDSITNSELMEGANEACITCHTHVAIDINWTKSYNMALTVTADHEGNWTVGNFESEGTYNVTTYGNMSGRTAWSNVTNITWANGTIVSNP